VVSPLTTLLLSLALVAQESVHRHPVPEEPQVLAPGYSALQFAAPKPGTYQLPPLGRAADGEVLDSSGSPTRLQALYGDKLVLLSFIYTSCADVNGCPLASFVLGLTQKRIMADPELKDRVRLISVSFDPAHDTPAVMASYGRGFRQDGFDWRFLTCRSEAALGPILDGYGQSVIRDYDSEGNYLGTMSHTLRVYLIDGSQRIRNIYSPAFLHADILLADLRTVLMEEEAGNQRHPPRDH